VALAKEKLRLGRSRTEGYGGGTRPTGFGRGAHRKKPREETKPMKLKLATMALAAA
jgi:hypothetical protein